MSPHLQRLNNKQNKIQHQLHQAVRSNYYNNKLLQQKQLQQLQQQLHQQSMQLQYRNSHHNRNCNKPYFK